MKRVFGILLVAVMVLAGGIVSVYAEGNDAENPQKIKVDIKNICTLLWVGDTPQFSVELDPSLSGKVNVISEKWIDIRDEGYELTVGGENIAVAGGQYRYELTLSTEKGFVFDNELTDVVYHGINGDYRLHYDFPPGEDSNHTMIVKGEFDNIIAESPLKIDVGKLLALIISGEYSQAVDFILDDVNHYSDKISVDGLNKYPVSDDKYSYELILKTKEGFYFGNTLQFLYDGEQYGYSIDYNYDLAEDRHTLKIHGLVEKKGSVPAASDLSPGASAVAADKFITNMTGDSDPKGAVFSRLRLKSTYQTNNSVKLSWNKQSKANSYVIYGSKCSGKPKRVAISTGNVRTIKSIGGSSLKKGTYYKFIIVAVDKNNKVVSTSKLIHVATKGGTVGNHKSVSVSSTVINRAKALKKGKTLKLNAKAIVQSKKLTVKKHVGLRYVTTNGKIATVSKSGLITAKKKGTCYIYAFAQDGVYKKIKVTVK